MALTVQYRFESFRPGGLNIRVELEEGTADWHYIHRRHNELAAKHGQPVLLYAYNDWWRQWDYIGKVVPGGGYYNHLGDGPFELSPDGFAYHPKKEGTN